MTQGRTLVLGGGGIAGIAWLAGLSFGLFEGGVDLCDADCMIGTSAGSVTAAQLRSGQPLAQLYSRQAEPALIAHEPAPSPKALAALRDVWRAAAELVDPVERVRAVGSLAVAAGSAPPEPRRAMIERRLARHDWPEASLQITAVDAASGELVAFHRASGVSLVDAVAASCAVPGLWPVVEISGRAYMDGGVLSADSAHLAQGAAKVLIASPMGEESTSFTGCRLSDDIALLERGGSDVLTICPDAGARKAIGANPLDPAVRIPSAVAGRAQGRALAAAVAAFWA